MCVCVVFTEQASSRLCVHTHRLPLSCRAPPAPTVVATAAYSTRAAERRQRTPDTETSHRGRDGAPRHPLARFSPRASRLTPPASGLLPHASRLTPHPPLPSVAHRMRSVYFVSAATLTTIHVVAHRSYCSIYFSIITAGSSRASTGSLRCATARSFVA